MKVTAALAWYDEPLELLEACVRGAAEIADKIVAVDGAYRRYPDAKPASPPAQAKLIRKTAAAVGLECDVVVPDKLWAGQVEKRSFLLERAAKGSDWIVPIDADHVIHANREAARAELEEYADEPLVVLLTVPFYTPKDPKRSIDDSAASHWHAGLAGKRIEHKHILRSMPGLRVERFHYWYTGVLSGTRVWVPFGIAPSVRRLGAAPYPVMDAQPLQAPYYVEHLTLQRDEKHILAGRAFCNDRVMVVKETGQEDDVPGLPAPKWDYETVPY
jgi:hypothetical protein